MFEHIDALNDDGDFYDANGVIGTHVATEWQMFNGFFWTIRSGHFPQVSNSIIISFIPIMKHMMPFLHESVCIADSKFLDFL